MVLLIIWFPSKMNSLNYLPPTRHTQSPYKESFYWFFLYLSNWMSSQRTRRMQPMLSWLDKWQIFAILSTILNILSQLKWIRKINYIHLLNHSNINTLYRILHIYSIFNEHSSMKALSFQKLFDVCDKNNQLKIIVDNLKNIESISREWNLDINEKR